MKNLVAVLLLGTLAGCATTGDINSSGTLSYADQEVVRKLAERARQVCVTYQYRDGPINTPITGNKSARDLPVVKRLYRSTGDWVKATTVINSVWGNVYFDPRTSRIACGDESWQKLSESRNLYFDEVVPVKATQSLYNTNPPQEVRQPTNTSTSMNSPDIEARLKKLKSLFDQGLVNESEYRTKQKQILDGL